MTTSTDTKTYTEQRNHDFAEPFLGTKGLMVLAEVLATNIFQGSLVPGKAARAEQDSQR